MKIIVLIFFLLLLLNYTQFLLKIIKGLRKLSSPSQNGIPDCFISIIIPFRNESKNILGSLESIEGLNYPEDKYEVIYVDDNSTDNSVILVKSHKRKSNIKILSLGDEISAKGNKKRALLYGIENSGGDIIVTTDADCVHPENWLNELLGCFDPQTAFVSGPVEFMESPYLFPKIQKIEFEGLILAGAGLIGSGNPVICNGANIAYRKSAFYEVGGLIDNLDLSSGDDVFLMQKITRLTNYKVKFCSSREAVVRTEYNRNIKDFFNQRKRWAGKSINYADKNLIYQLSMIFIFYSGLLIQMLLILAGFYLFLITFVLSIATKTALEFVIIKKGESLFFHKNSASIFFLTELIHIPYILISVIAGLFGNFTWKNRRIKR